MPRSTSLPALNFPSVDVRTDGEHIFDPFRKKWLVLTPEEWVRQHFLTYLHQHLGYPRSLIKVEQGLTVAGNAFRADAVIYNNNIKPLALLECKAPHIRITEKTFEQLAVYTARIRARLIMASNGRNHYICLFSRDFTSYRFLDNIPDYTALCQMTD
ncbi:MAG: type I restriction enzyme HsdR N-terminal domain-containing protein [Calditrichaeota bacterium]|nr:MAG: type I restriction enzyme HsdR N-terminal domain-containing protein [Calditrichota bacterium]